MTHVQTTTTIPSYIDTVLSDTKRTQYIILLGELDSGLPSWEGMLQEKPESTASKLYESN